jgi:uncharacterized delta-60 repeat protein
MRKLTFLFLLFFSLSVFSQGGTLDTSFNTSDTGFGNGGTSNNVIYSSITQPDGKIIVCGNFTTYMGISRNRIARLNADLSLDTTFNPGTAANNSIQAIALKSDGKILIGGNFTSFNGTAVNRIACLNADGTIDTSFNVGSGANNTVNAFALQSDGKIIVGGNFSAYKGVTQNRVIRLNTDGSADSSFNVGAGADANISTLKIQANGKVILAGSFSTFDGNAKGRIIRLNADGSPDAGFVTGSGFDTTVNSVALQADGKILVGGLFSSYNGTALNRMARLESNGAPDNGFNFTAVAFSSATEGVQNIAVLTDGKILVANRDQAAQDVQTGVFRLNTNGAVDNSFATGYAPLSIFYSVVPQVDGSIIVTGTFTNYNKKGRAYLVRLNANGNPRTPYNLGTGATGTVGVMKSQADNKVVIGGNFVGYNGVLSYRLARLNQDGTLDTGFTTGEGADDAVLDLALQPDNKIIVAGAFKKFQNTVKNYIVRVNPDGSLDTAFVSGFDANGGKINAIQLLSDGKIIAVGNFASHTGFSRKGIVRLNANGTLDMGFSPGTGIDTTISSIYSVAVQPDGKIIIGGDFTAYNGVSRNNIARLNADGSLDATFNPATGGNDSVDAINILPNGKIIIAGNLTQYNNVTVNGIARINADGSLDNSFVMGTGFNVPLIYDVKVEADGKLLIGGSFSNYNGTSVNNLVRLNPDGSVNNSYSNVSGANGTINAIEFLSDNKILIGGSFTAYDNIGKNRIARLNYDTLSNDPFTEKEFVVFPNPAKDFVMIASEDGIDSIEVYAVNGQKVISTSNLGSSLYQLNTSGLNEGIYVGYITSGQEKKTVKIIKG